MAPETQQDTRSPFTGRPEETYQLPEEAKTRKAQLIRDYTDPQQGTLHIAPENLVVQAYVLGIVPGSVVPGVNDYGEWLPHAAPSQKYLTPQHYHRPIIYLAKYLINDRQFIDALEEGFAEETPEGRVAFVNLSAAEFTDPLTGEMMTANELPWYMRPESARYKEAKRMIMVNGALLFSSLLFAPVTAVGATGAAAAAGMGVGRAWVMRSGASAIIFAIGEMMKIGGPTHASFADWRSNLSWELGIDTALTLMVSGLTIPGGKTTIFSAWRLMSRWNKINGAINQGILNAQQWFPIGTPLTAAEIAQRTKEIKAGYFGSQALVDAYMKGVKVPWVGGFPDWFQKKSAQMAALSDDMIKPWVDDFRAVASSMQDKGKQIANLFVDWEPGRFLKTFKFLPAQENIERYIKERRMPGGRPVLSSGGKLRTQELLKIQGKLLQALELKMPQTFDLWEIGEKVGKRLRGGAAQRARRTTIDPSTGMRNASESAQNLVWQEVRANAELLEDTLMTKGGRGLAEELGLTGEAAKALEAIPVGTTFAQLATQWGDEGKKVLDLLGITLDASRVAKGATFAGVGNIDEIHAAITKALSADDPMRGANQVGVKTVEEGIAYVQKWAGTKNNEAAKAVQKLLDAIPRLLDDAGNYTPEAVEAAKQLGIKLPSFVKSTASYRDLRYMAQRLNRYVGQIKSQGADVAQQQSAQSAVSAVADELAGQASTTFGREAGVTTQLLIDIRGRSPGMVGYEVAKHGNKLERLIARGARPGQSRKSFHAELDAAWEEVRVAEDLDKAYERFAALKRMEVAQERAVDPNILSGPAQPLRRGALGAALGGTFAYASGVPYQAGAGLGGLFGMTFLSPGGLGRAGDAAENIWGIGRARHAVGVETPWAFTPENPFPFVSSDARYMQQQKADTPQGARMRATREGESAERGDIGPQLRELIETENEKTRLRSQEQPQVTGTPGPVSRREVLPEGMVRDPETGELMIRAVDYPGRFGIGVETPLNPMLTSRRKRLTNQGLTA